MSASFTFTSHEFTNAGIHGRSGPSLANCKTAYSGTSWASDARYFTVIDGIQFFTIPQTGSYQIKTQGGSGGDNNSPHNPKRGGLGAYVTANYTFTKGDKLAIVVGNKGVTKNGETWPGTGGGGAAMAPQQQHQPGLRAAASSSAEHGQISHRIFVARPGHTVVHLSLIHISEPTRPY